MTPKFLLDIYKKKKPYIFIFWKIFFKNLREWLSHLCFWNLFGHPTYRYSNFANINYVSFLHFLIQSSSYSALIHFLLCCLDKEKTLQIPDSP